MAATESYWDSVAEAAAPDRFQRIWRRHSDWVNRSLASRWLPASNVDSVLKTDLFDEAVAEGLYPLLAARAGHVAGIDISHQIVRAALERHSALEAVCADVRRLPFASERFDAAVSISTLDHFESLDDVAVSLAEINRTLRPGGRLVVTLDNRSNPVVALRNALPFGLLNSMRVVPYYVGATCGPRRLRSMLEQSGFDVVREAAVQHAPRAAAIALAGAIERFSGPRAEQRLLASLRGFERLSEWPTRYATGYFSAALAIKCA